MSCRSGGCSNRRSVERPTVKASSNCVPDKSATSGGSNIVRTITPPTITTITPPPPPPPPPECIAAPPVVTIFPPSGTYVEFPTIVLLQVTRADSDIYYTIDGTEPTKNSTLYIAGFLIPDHNYVVKARAFPRDNCPPGPIATAQWLDVPLENFTFAYLCTQADNVGRFFEFAPNGEANDYQWRLAFTLAGLTEIRRIVVYETDRFGNWDTGQVWSTELTIYPYTDPTIPFNCYPLVIKSEPGAIQLFNDYQATLGSYAIGNYEWRLWGQQQTLLGGNSYFRLVITLGDGRIIERIVIAVCVPPPPPCVKPADPNAVPDCTPQVVLSGVTPNANQIWKLSRRAVDAICGSLGWEDIATGISDGVNAWEHEDFAVQKCCDYYYKLGVLCPETLVYRFSDQVGPVHVPCEGSVSIEADKTETCEGDAVTLAWASSGCDSVSIDNGIGVVGPEGTVVVNPLVTTTYTITCNNAACGNVTANVTITVNPVSTPGCGCFDYNDNAQVTVPLSLIVTIRSSSTGLVITVPVTRTGGNPIRVSEVYYEGNSDGNFASVQPGFCQFGDEYAWLTQVYNDPAPDLITWSLAGKQGTTPVGNYEVIDNEPFHRFDSCEVS